MARSILLSTILAFSPSLYAETFSPKVVCLDKNEAFLGWMTLAECEQQKGLAPAQISQAKGQNADK